MKLTIVFIILSITTINLSFAQYPKVSSEDKQKTEAIMQAAMEHSDMAWEKALPIIMEEAKNGKPYIPWASRPTDLPQADIPAFPGAEGGGAYTFGGRGGKVIVVTSLEDSGPGTFREACEQGGARIVIFNVAGIIRLKSPLIIRAPYITIAGQTAPGDGVCIAGESVWIDTHDVVVRHMRFRRGDTFVGRRDDALGGNPIGNIIIDHVSTSWGLDENISMYRHMYDPGDGSNPQKLPTVNITFQNCISSEALDTYNHSFGSTLGGENCTFIRNLWANNTGRNPSIGWNGITTFANNVVYNWRHRSVDGGDYKATFNIVNNYFKPGPVTPDDHIGHRILKPESGRSKLDSLVFGRAYVAGNIVEGNEKVSKNNWDGGVQVESLPHAAHYTDLIRVNKPFPMANFRLMSAQDAYKYVLDNVGATLPKRDAVDTRVVHQIRTGEIEYSKGLDPDGFYQFEHRRLEADSYKQGIITDISQVGGYPEYKGKPYKDADGDGMPDDWEKKYGLNPFDPSDANGDLNGDGYTNIEKFINGIDPSVKVDWSVPGNNYDLLASNDEYTKVITKRAEKIVAELKVRPDVALAARDIIVKQYRHLNEVHERYESESKRTSGATAEALEHGLRSQLYQLHVGFLVELSALLGHDGVETIKDGMTYGIFPITYNNYLSMLPELTEAQKLKVRTYLMEAREFAMDASSSDEKHKWFGKYKGKINNYLSAEGYDLKKAGEEWQRKIKEDAQK